MEGAGQPFQKFGREFLLPTSLLQLFQPFAIPVNDVLEVIHERFTGFGCANDVDRVFVLGPEVHLGFEFERIADPVQPIAALDWPASSWRSRQADTNAGQMVINSSHAPSVMPAQRRN